MLTVMHVNCQTPVNILLAGSVRLVLVIKSQWSLHTFPCTVKPVMRQMPEDHTTFWTIGWSFKMNFYSALVKSTNLYELNV